MQCQLHAGGCSVHLVIKIRLLIEHNRVNDLMAGTSTSVSKHCSVCAGNTRLIFLHCGHVICRKCVLQSLVRSPTGDNSFACFVCQRVTPPDAPPVNRGNSKDETRMDGITEGKQEYNMVINEGEITEATSSDSKAALCESCLPMQRGQQNGDPNRGKTLPEKPVPKPLCYDKCDAHDEFVKVFCKDCKMAVCHVCCSISHRGCEEVISLQDALGDLTARILERKEENLENVEKTKIMRAKRNKFILQISENTNKMRDNVKRAIKEAIEILKTKESALLKELDEFERQKTKELIDDNFVDDVIIRGMEAELDVIDGVVQSTELRGICQMYEKIESRLAIEPLSDVQKPQRIGFKWDQSDAEAAIGGSTFGATYTVDAGDVGRETTPILQMEIRIASQQDESDPDVADIVVIGKGEGKIILVTDVKNKCIKSFNADGTLACKSEQKMEEGPFGITSSDDSNVLVSFLQNDVVAKFSTKPIKYLGAVTQGRSYRGLAKYKDGNMIACRFPFLGKSSIDVINSSGKVLRKMNIGFNRSPLFACSTQDGGVLAADNSTKSLLHVSPGGKVSQLYRPKGQYSIVNPRAITVTKTGDILLADFGAHKIIHLTTNGEFIRDLITKKDGINRPHSIVLDEEGLLYVTCGTCVKVFRFE